MGNKIVVVFMLALSCSAYAAERVSMEEIAKAMELLIIDVKKQKNILQAVSTDRNTTAIAADVAELKRQIEDLKQKSVRTEEKNTALQKRLSELERSGQSDKRGFIVEPIKEAIAAPDGALHKTTARLKVHSEPSMESQTISYLPHGAVVDVFEIHKSGMAKTGLGWVSKYYLSPLGKEKK